MGQVFPPKSVTCEQCFDNYDHGIYNHEDDTCVYEEIFRDLHFEYMSFSRDTCSHTFPRTEASATELKKWNMAAFMAYSDTNTTFQACTGKTDVFGDEKVLSAAKFVDLHEGHDWEVPIVSYIAELGDADTNVVSDILISFRGTSEGFQHLAEEAIDIITEDKVSFNPSDSSLGEVEKYFRIALLDESSTHESLWAEMKAHIKSASWKTGSQDIIVTGHSLGAAVATLFALQIANDSELKDDLKDRIKLVTYSSPRVGNFKFALAVAKEYPDAVRVVHGTDPIPHWENCDWISGDDSEWGYCIPHETSSFHVGREVWFVDSNGADPLDLNHCGYDDTVMDADGDVKCSNYEYRNYWQSIWEVAGGVAYHTKHFNVENGFCNGRRLEEQPAAPARNLRNSVHI